MVMGYAAWDELSAGSAAKFHGNSSSMRLMGCSAMRDRRLLCCLIGQCAVVEI